MKKETGMIFKAPLVRAILNGQKTQTRRIVKPQPTTGQGMVNASYCGAPNLWLRDGPCSTSDPVYEWRCPYGQPGDRIYVRETFVQGYKTDPATGVVRNYDKDGNDIPMTTWYRATDGGISWSDDDGWEANVPWKPAIHMPKALARIWLEITGVRAEQLQNICEADAEAEGIGFLRDLPDADETLSAKDLFECLWGSTGGDWSANPWVWVIDFKRIQP